MRGFSCRTPRSLVLTFLAAACVFPGAAQGAGLRKIWDFRLTDPEGSSAGSTVFGLYFSRDGRQLAAVVGRSGRATQLWVLDAVDPQENHSKLDLNPPLMAASGAQPRIDWSLDGRRMLIAGNVVNVRTGIQCTLPLGGFGFTGPDQLVSYQSRPSRIVLFDLECQETGSWTLPKNDRADLFDVSAERGLVFLTQQRISRLNVSAVASVAVDVKTKRVVRRLQAPTKYTISPAFFAKPIFAESGLSYCGIRGQDSSATVGCATVDTSHVLNVKEGLSYPDIRTAHALSRVVILEYSKRLDWIELRWFPGPVKVRTIWDFRSGKVVGRWRS